MKSKTEELTEWLRDAYAMEKSMEQMLRRTVDDDKAILPVREAARAHLIETTRHVDDVERCLEIIGADTSVLKTGAATVGEFFKDILAAFASDKAIKDLLAAYAGEHFEIGCYTAIRAAAQSIGEGRIVAICDSILEDEQRAAKRLKECIPGAIEGYFGSRATKTDK